MLRAGGLRRGERVSPVHGDADWHAVRIQRGGAESVTREAVDAEPLQEDVGSLSIQTVEAGRVKADRKVRSLGRRGAAATRAGDSAGVHAGARLVHASRFRSL